MRQPYIYTMPEKFMSDDSVPIKWRLYGYINGYWIGGKPVYATNEHFAEKFKCSERHISRALAELESDGLLMRNINGLKRFILPGGMTPEVRGGRRGASAKDDVGGQHISVSIISDTSEAKLRVERVTKEDEEVTPRQKTDLTYRKVFELWPKYPLNWRANRTEIAAAKNILAEHSLEEARNALNYAKQNEHEEKCPQMLKPSDLDRKWVNLQAFRDKR